MFCFSPNADFLAQIHIKLASLVHHEKPQNWNGYTLYALENLNEYIVSVSKRKNWNASRKIRRVLSNNKVCICSWCLLLWESAWTLTEIRSPVRCSRGFSRSHTLTANARASTTSKSFTLKNEAGTSCLALLKPTKGLTFDHDGHSDFIRPQ